MKFHTAVIAGLLAAVGVIFIGLPGLRGADPPVRQRIVETSDETPVLMRAKLISSQKIMEGLVTKDFDLISKGSKDLVKISDAAAFRKYRDPVYQHYNREFRRLVEKLGRLSKDTNLEGATFTYIHATTTCINCHEYVRDVIKIADHNKSGSSPFRLLDSNQSR